MKKAGRSTVLIPILILPLCIFPLARPETPGEGKRGLAPKLVVINGRSISVEVADTPDLHVRGLSDRQHLPEGYGMLFVFPDKQHRTFWMRRMHFSLDILWIDDDRISQIDTYLPPEGNLPQNAYSSRVPVNYVLEIPGGLAERYNIRIGDRVTFQY